MGRIGTRMQRSIAHARVEPLKKSPRCGGACRRPRTHAKHLVLRHRGGVMPRAKDKEGEEPAQAEEPKLTLGGLAELVGLGMGVPVPAKVELDMEKKQLIAEFEANNFDQEQKYRDEGYVDNSASSFNWLTLLWLPVLGAIGYGIFITL